MTSKIPFYCSDGHIGHETLFLLLQCTAKIHLKLDNDEASGLRCHSQAIPLVKGINSMVDSVPQVLGPLPLVRRPRSFRNVPISKRIVVLAEALRKASCMIKLWETKP